MTQFIRNVFAFSVVLSAGAISGTAILAADPIKERKELMKEHVGKSMGLSVKMVKGEIEYDAAKAEAAMKEIAGSVDKFKTLFPEGSIEDESTDSKTRAKADIWKNMKDFAEKADALKTVTLKVAATAKDGRDAFAAAIGDVGKACKSCHEKYRLKKD